MDQEKKSTGTRIAMKVSSYTLVELVETNDVRVVVHGLHADYWLLDPIPPYKKVQRIFVR